MPLPSSFLIHSKPYQLPVLKRLIEVRQHFRHPWVIPNLIWNLLTRITRHTAIHEGLIFRCRAIASCGPWSFITMRYNRAAAKVSFKGIPDRIQNDGLLMRKVSS